MPAGRILHYELPLAEIVTDFYDRLKSVSRGYASFDYEPKTMRAADLVKLDILINGDPTDALSVIIHRDKAHDWGRELYPPPQRPHPAADVRGHYPGCGW